MELHFGLCVLWSIWIPHSPGNLLLSDFLPKKIDYCFNYFACTSFLLFLAFFYIFITENVETIVLFIKKFWEPMQTVSYFRSRIHSDFLVCLISTFGSPPEAVEIIKFTFVRMSVRDQEISESAYQMF